MATAPSPNDLTRQQLDELDALLQRMLSVPLPPDALPSPVPAGTGGGGRDGSTPGASARGVESGAALADPPLPPSWRVDPPAAPRPPSAPAGSFVSGSREGSGPAPHLALVDPPSSVSLKLEPPVPTPSALTQTPAPAAPLKSVAKPAPPPIPAPKATPAAPPPVAVSAPPLPKSAPVPAPAPAPKVDRGLTPAPAPPPVPFLFLPFVALNALFDAGCELIGPFGRVLRSGFFKQLYGLTGLGLLLYTAAHIAQGREWVTLPVRLPWPQ